MESTVIMGYAEELRCALRVLSFFFIGRVYFSSLGYEEELR